MDLSDSFFLTTPIWARLLDLPLEFWHEDIFKDIASSFGELVALENAMTSRTKLHCARIFVKVVDLNHLPNKVELIAKLGKKLKIFFLKICPTLAMLARNSGIWLEIVLPRVKRFLLVLQKGKSPRFTKRKFGNPKLFLAKFKRIMKIPLFLLLRREKSPQSKILMLHMLSWGVNLLIN